MRLFHQLVIMLSVFTTIIVTVVMLLNFKTTTQFVENQLYTDSVNTSHWLSLSLSTDEEVDFTKMEVTIDAIFDSGFYEKIVLRDSNKNIIYERYNPLVVYNVPEWFLDFIQINNETIPSDITINWQQVAELSVYGHRGNAYAQLYSIFINLIKTFILIGVVGFISLYFLLLYSLSSLKYIQEQAKGILNHKFIIAEKLPFTSDLKSVVVAMNSMVSKVQDIFDKNFQILQKYHEVLYKDNETNLYNRRYLKAKITSYLQSKQQGNGYFIMFSMDGLEQFKKEYGYITYHEFLIKFSKILKTYFNKQNKSLIVRLNESDFIILVQTNYIDDCVNFIQDIMIQVEKNMDDINTGVKNDLIVGSSIIKYSSNDTLSLLLSNSDKNVVIAKHEKNFSIKIDQNKKNNIGRSDFREKFLEYIEKSTFSLDFLPVVEIKNNAENILIHQEVKLSFNEDFYELNESDFYAIVDTLGLTSYIKKYIIEKVIHGKMNNIAINLKEDFIKDKSNFDWLHSKLLSYKKNKNIKLFFEINNDLVLEELEISYKFYSMIKSFNHEIGIDNFILPEEGIDYLKFIQPNYIKSNGMYLYDMFYNEKTGESNVHFYNMIRTLGIDLIATNIDNNEDKNNLLAVGINKFQGTVIS